MVLLTYLKLTLTTDIRSSTVAETLLNEICRPFIVSKYSMTKVPHESHIRWWWGGSITQKSAANKPRPLEKESLIQIGAANILAESLKVGPET